MINIKRQFGFIALGPALFSFLVRGATLIMAGVVANNWYQQQNVSGMFLSGDSTPGSAFESSYGGIYVHLDPNREVALSNAERDAGWTSSKTGILPPTVLPRYWPYNAGSPPVMNTGAGIGCSIGTSPVYVGNVAYRSVKTTDWNSGLVSPNSSNYVQQNYNKYWQSTGSTCSSVAGMPNDSMYITLSSPCPYGSQTNANNLCVPIDGSVSTTVQKPSDGVCKIVRVGNLFTANYGDPDCQDPKISPTFSSDKSTILAFDDTGRNGNVISIDPAGRITATNQKAIPDTNYNTTTTLTMNSVTNNNGTTNISVVGATTNTTVGGGVNSTPVSDTKVEATINLPPNLAKTEDVNKVSAALTTDPGLTPPTMDGLDDTISTLKTHATIATIPSIFSFSPPILSDKIIPTIDVPILKEVIHLDITVWADYIRSFFGVLLYLTTPWIIFNIFRGRKE